jgi:hypothetical protein
MRSRTQNRAVRVRTAAGSGLHDGVRSYLNCGSSYACGGYNSMESPRSARRRVQLQQRGRGHWASAASVRGGGLARS